MWGPSWATSLPGGVRVAFGSLAGQIGPIGYEGEYLGAKRALPGVSAIVAEHGGPGRGAAAPQIFDAHGLSGGL